MKEAEPGLSTWMLFTKWIIAKAKGKSIRAQVFKLVNRETIYAVWLERNQSIFAKQQKQTHQIIRGIACTCRVMHGHSGQLRDETDTPNPSQKGNYLQQVVLTKDAKYRQQTNETNEKKVQHAREHQVEIVFKNVQEITSWF
ncbi:hypothetical protein FXO38_08698 [Capsicum annuum]|uniref:uncharacterized protein LOC124888683 n=1 Tax=Capsicum annuum TaxID=4072 RepID=UPI001FB06E1F|nr:uncharacterized protein LOC124888683 [Capsicum annuum]KAF3667258.1 hypothetical protein FXO38_08698 [Capsicum annuum]